MAFRVTPNLSISQFLSQLTAQNSRVAGLQQQASSGLRISRPSDDPAGLRSILRAEEAITRLETRTESISAARFRLEQAHTAVREAQTQFIRAESIASQGVQAIDPAEREILAREVDSLISSLESIANLQVAGEYVFAGIASDRAPFPAAGTSSAAAYAGSVVPRTLQFHDGPPTVVLASGAEVFQPQSRGQTLYLGTTGAAAGTGTDSARGQGTLLVTHTATSYAPGAGITASASSAGTDTIIGSFGAHRLTLVDDSGTGAFGTVSLNGGPPIAFTNADTNLQVVGPAGEIVHIDTTAITGGFSGDIDITATGSLSTDDGATSIPINFSANQTVTDSRTGAVTNVDTTAIHVAGAESLEYTGTADAFAVLRELRDDLRNVRGLLSGEQAAAIGRRLTDLQRVRNHFLDVVGEQSATLTYLDDMETQAEGAQLEFKRQVSDLATADIAQVAVELRQAQTQLQYTMATAAGLFETTLLNFLR